MAEPQAQDNYSLKELCQEAGVTERTIRYYIQEGLIPPPQGAGQSARYNTTHLLRLRLIRRLKDEYLPLAEIRRRLAQVDPETLETIISQEEVPAPALAEAKDAKSYLDNLLGKRSVAAPLAYSPVSPAQAPVPPAPAAAAPALTSSAPKPAYQMEPETGEEEWRRVTVAPDVEIHYRPGDNQQQKRVSDLLEQARKIFRK